MLACLYTLSFPHYLFITAGMSYPAARKCPGYVKVHTYVGRVKGGATILRVGVEILLRTKRAENFWGLYPTYAIQWPSGSVV